jgi:hypothetical protein
MNRPLWLPLVFLVLAAAGLGFWLTAAGSASALAPQPAPTAEPSGHIATAAELAAAQMEWAASAHAETYDLGLGANTTCARCKSPTNWDPAAEGAEAALDCGSCKRVPGAPRPDLEGGVPVAQADWQHITCAVCHIPAGDSYYTGLAYWDQASRSYQAVASVGALCEHCHEGRHGFFVFSEQAQSPAHQGWECTECHGAHGAPSACQDCHDPAQGLGADDHARHPQVNCTACHDAGGLSLWTETNPASKHAGTVVPLRFAHTLTSWPSHNLQTPVRCERCHHPGGDESPPLAAEVSCEACHPDGAALLWCEFFPRDKDPNAKP